MVAHEDSVTAVLFQPETHYFFSAGKDGVCKYWDADRYCKPLMVRTAVCVEPCCVGRSLAGPVPRN